MSDSAVRSETSSSISFVVRESSRIDGSSDSSPDIPQSRSKCREFAKRTIFSQVQIEALRRYVATNAHSDFTVQEFSRIVGLTQWHFSRRFRSVFGVSPHRYVIEHRLTRARDLLANSTLSIVDVAAECGFCDQAHLGRMFRKYFRCSPGRWRREHVAGRSSLKGPGESRQTERMRDAY